MSQLENIDLNEVKSREDEQTMMTIEDADMAQDLVNMENSDENKETPASEEHAEMHEETGAEKIHNAHLEALMKEIDLQPTPEAKLQRAIAFMEESLSQGKTPHFKSFWQARDLCLQLFKENIPPAMRSSFWAKYSELSKEARRLKDLLDEQSAFAVEQIEIAIQALENDIAGLEQQGVQNTDDIVLNAKALEEKNDYYVSKQKEINILNTQAARINALRKELIKTEMRVRKKNKFFQRLSAAGDKVFPRRKELIQEISNQFISDINAFVKINFAQEKPHQPYYFLRDEIKALQGAAKLLTLNSTGFSQTRMLLSECWDKVKELDKERKHERAQKKAAFKQNVDAVMQKITEFDQGIQSGQLSTNDANNQFEEIVGFMRSVELGRDEVKFLRDKLSQARKPLLDKAKNEEQERQEQERERVRLKKQKVIDLRQNIENLLQNASNFDAEKILAERASLIEQIGNVGVPKAEKQDLERMLKPLNDLISEKKEQAMMSLSDDDRQALQQLREVLKQRKERRQVAKEQLESLRKAKGGSGFDFEQALVYNTQLNEEKERLEKINQGIQEIEQKIAELEQKI
jgi:hypothetical protein